MSVGRFMSQLSSLTSLAPGARNCERSFEMNVFTVLTLIAPLAMVFTLTAGPPYADGGDDDSGDQGSEHVTSPLPV